MPIDAVTIYLDDKRRAVGTWWQKMQHAVGGVPLLIAGIHGLRDPALGHRAVALAEITCARTFCSARSPCCSALFTAPTPTCCAVAALSTWTARVSTESSRDSGRSTCDGPTCTMFDWTLAR